MLSPEQINEIHRLHLVEKWPQRRIARHLHIGRHTLAKYLDNPAPLPSRRDRTSKLDAFKPAVTDLLQQDPQAPAQVLFQRLQTLGYDGGITILKDYLQAVRKNAVLRRAYVRMEPSPGERFDIDWGHFGALTYNGTPRKLYAFCLVECHSRKMYLEFTHSQSFETFVRCHMHAFQTLGGCARELWFDNLATAVAEHEGNLVRFNPRFLAFAREYSFIPRACHVAAAWEKGKVERAIGYVRQNFWPLRSFADLSDVNAQARRWLQEIANRRKHRETGQAPDDRSCNSWESKYKYRQAERLCPMCGKAAILKSRDGSGWFCWRRKDGCGTNFAAGDPRIQGQEVGRRINPDMADVVNTVLKMAQKRAKVSTTINATSASEFFTQDVEDNPATLVEDTDPHGFTVDIGLNRYGAREAREYVRDTKLAGAGRTSGDGKPPSPAPRLTGKGSDIKTAFAQVRERIGEVRYLEEMQLAGIRDIFELRQLDRIQALYARLWAIAELTAGRVA